MKTNSELFISQKQIIKDEHRCWIEISLTKLKNNIDIIKSIISDKIEIICILRANCYGFDYINVVKYLSFIGIKYFAVSTLEEALALRKCNFRGEIMILNWTSISKKEVLIQNNITQILFDYNYANKLNKFPNKVKSIIKIDTGIDLFGFNMNQIKLIKDCYFFKNLKIEGILTDLSLIQDNGKDEDNSKNLHLEKFTYILQILKKEGINIGKKFIINSLGIEELKNYEYELFSIGLLIFGFFPKQNYKLINSVLLENNFKPIISLRCKVMTIKYLKKGEKVGYNGKFISKEKTKIATISMGYADGLSFSCSKNQLKVIVKDKLCPLIGNICMDCSIIKIPLDVSIIAGETVTIFGYNNEGNYLNLDEFILKNCLSVEEISSRLSKRIEKLYHQ